MQIKYSVIRQGDRDKLQPEKVYKFRIEEIKNCCDKMKAAQGISLLAPNIENANGSTEPQMSFVDTIIDDDNSPGNFREEYRPISHCPFCGEKIEYQKIKDITLKERREKVRRVVLKTVKEEIWTDENVYEEVETPGSSN